MFFLGSQTRVTSDEQVVHGTLSRVDVPGESFPMK
jgi:hypothetical protein